MELRDIGSFSHHLRDTFTDVDTRRIMSAGRSIYLTPKPVFAILWRDKTKEATRYDAQFMPLGCSMASFFLIGSLKYSFFTPQIS